MTDSRFTITPAEWTLLTTGDLQRMKSAQVEAHYWQLPRPFAAPAGTRLTNAVMIDAIQRAQAVYWEQKSSKGRPPGSIPKLPPRPQDHFPARHAGHHHPRQARKPIAGPITPGVTAAECNDWLATLPPVPLVGEI